MLNTTTIQAGATVEFFEPGNFFRLLDTQAAVTVAFYNNGAQVALSESVLEGYAEKFNDGQFDRIRITSATTQTIQYVVRLGNEVHYDQPPNGQVTVTNTGGAFSQNQKTVTNTTGQLLAANTARRYLLIQNNDASGDVYVTLDGTAATTAKGIKIAAGGSYECQNFCPTGAINAIGSIASNANVVAVEA